MRYPYHWFWLTAVVVGLDQLTKVLAAQMLVFAQQKPLIPLFNLMLIHNDGAAFSFLSGAGGWQRWFFVLLSIAISIAIVVWICRLSRQERWTAAALALVLGGAIGNLIDRILYGYVIDFIDFYYSSQDGCLPLFAPLSSATCHWPTFNIADSAICVGAFGLLLMSVLIPPPSQSSEQ